MRRIWPALVLLLGSVSLASAQTLSEYLKLRKHYGISQAAEAEALETFVGTRVVEIKGTVKGSFKIKGLYTILLERSDGDNIGIESASQPDWLSGGEVHCRLIVKATRTEDNSELKASLLGAAPEQAIAPIDAEVQRKAALLAQRENRRVEASRHSATRHADWNLPASTAAPIYAAFIHKENPRLSSQDARLIADGIIGFSIKYGVDARLIMAMVMVESGFDPHSTSRTGAKGLGQLMPGTARWMGVTDSYDTVDNLYGTVKLVRNHLDKYRVKTGDGFQSLVLALAAYNAGEGAVQRSGGVPPYRETQAYVRRVIGLYAHFCGVN